MPWTCNACSCSNPAMFMTCETCLTDRNIPTWNCTRCHLTIEESVNSYMCDECNVGRENHHWVCPYALCCHINPLDADYCLRCERTTQNPRFCNRCRTTDRYLYCNTCDFCTCELPVCSRNFHLIRQDILQQPTGLAPDYWAYVWNSCFQSIVVAYPEDQQRLIEIDNKRIEDSRQDRANTMARSVLQQNLLNGLPVGYSVDYVNSDEKCIICQFTMDHCGTCAELLDSCVCCSICHNEPDECKCEDVPVLVEEKGCADEPDLVEKKGCVDEPMEETPSAGNNQFEAIKHNKTCLFHRSCITRLFTNIRENDVSNTGTLKCPICRT
jgi:hypothetical protein